MSFEAYLRNIHARTGKTPEELRALAAEAGVFTPTMKAGELVAWLKREFESGSRPLDGGVGRVQEQRLGARVPPEVRSGRGVTASVTDVRS